MLRQIKIIAVSHNNDVYIQNRVQFYYPDFQIFILILEDVNWELVKVFTYYFVLLLGAK